MRSDTAYRTALLVLQDGATFEGRSEAGAGAVFGRAVVCSTMTGFHEELTDPSHRGALLVMASPHVGNTGINAADARSPEFHLAGLVLREPTTAPSNWRAEQALGDALAQAGVVTISGVDTRALTRHLRQQGPLSGGIFAGPQAHEPVGTLVERVRQAAHGAADQAGHPQGGQHAQA